MLGADRQVSIGIIRVLSASRWHGAYQGISDWLGRRHRTRRANSESDNEHHCRGEVADYAAL